MSLKHLPLLAWIATLSACAGAQPVVLHDDAGLPLYTTEHTQLRTDLPAEEAELFASRIDTLELAIDSAFPWLTAGEGLPKTLILVDAARFTLMAQDHAAPPQSAAFVCAEGELVYRYRADLWRESAGAPVPTEPRIRPLAATVLRRRLLAHGKDAHGEDPSGESPTWLEEGLVAVFVELAAEEFGEVRRTVRRNRERLLDAFLPRYLGGPPILRRLCGVRGRAEMKRTGSPAVAWAAVRFLLSDAELTPLLALGLRFAAGDESAEEPWDAALQTLATKESDFERFLLHATLRELLVGFRDGKTAVDRWECADALRLIANLDLNSDADDASRAAQFLGSEEILTESPPLPRFFDKYARELRGVHEARSQLRAVSKLKSRIRKELARRARGYGHPAIEFAKRDLGRALQRALAAPSTR